MKRRSRAHHCDRAGGVETEEEDAGLPGPRHVRPEVQFGERGDPGEGGESPGTQTLQAEGRDRDPRRAGVAIERQALGDVWAQTLGIDRPMGKEEIAPPLRHDPGPGRERPGPMPAEAPGASGSCSRGSPAAHEISSRGPSRPKRPGCKKRRSARQGRGRHGPRAERSVAASQGAPPHRYPIGAAGAPSTRESQCRRDVSLAPCSGVGDVSRVEATRSSARARAVLSCREARRVPNRRRRTQGPRGLRRSRACRRMEQALGRPTPMVDGLESLARGLA